LSKILRFGLKIPTSIYIGIHKSIMIWLFALKKMVIFWLFRRNTEKVTRQVWHGNAGIIFNACCCYLSMFSMAISEQN
jgi:hypothetical protein